MPTKDNQQKSVVIPRSGSPIERLKDLLVGKKLIKKALVVAAIFLVLLIIGQLVQLIRMRTSPDSDQLPTPTPVQYVGGKPSVYASDPQILESESELDKIENLLKEIDLSESKLMPPNLDMNVSF